MKRFKLYILLSAIITALGFWSCEQEISPEYFPPADIDFTYSSSSLHYVVGEEIQFLNLSVKGSSWEWDFGDGSTSNEQSPVHQYTLPGTYTVVLNVDGTHQVEKKLMISDIVPVVNYTSTDQVIVFNQTQVSFDVLLENPENKPVEYNWKFPAGTI